MYRRAGAADCVAGRVGGQAIRHQLDSGAGCNDTVSVVELVGALGDDQERQAERERAEGRAGATVGRDSGAVREQLLLRDVPVHVDVRRLWTEHRRVVLRAYRDDDVQLFVAEPVEERAEHVEIVVVDGAQRDVDDRQPGQRIEPRELDVAVGRVSTVRMPCTTPGPPRDDLEAGRAYVEVQVAVEATKGVRREAARNPEGGSGVAGGTDDVFWMAGP